MFLSLFDQGYRFRQVVVCTQDASKVETIIQDNGFTPEIEAYLNFQLTMFVVFGDSGS